MKTLMTGETLAKVCWTKTSNCIIWEVGQLRHFVGAPSKGPRIGQFFPLFFNTSTHLDTNTQLEESPLHKCVSNLPNESFISQFTRNIPGLTSKIGMGTRHRAIINSKKGLPDSKNSGEELNKPRRKRKHSNSRCWVSEFLQTNAPIQSEEICTLSKILNAN